MFIVQSEAAALAGSPTQILEPFDMGVGPQIGSQLGVVAAILASQGCDLFNRQLRAPGRERQVEGGGSHGVGSVAGSEVAFDNAQIETAVSTPTMDDLGKVIQSILDLGDVKPSDYVIEAGESKSGDVAFKLTSGEDSSGAGWVEYRLQASGGQGYGERVEPKRLGAAMRAGRPLIPKLLDGLGEPPDFVKMAEEADYGSRSLAMELVHLGRVTMLTTYDENPVEAGKPKGYSFGVKTAGWAPVYFGLDKDLAADAVESSGPVFVHLLRSEPEIGKAIVEAFKGAVPNIKAKYQAAIDKAALLALGLAKDLPSGRKPHP